MATKEVVTAKPEPVDPWSTDKATWQFVTIPDRDLTDQKYPPIWLNKIEFQSGQTYSVPPPVAQYLNDRIRAYNRSVTRLFSPARDMDAVNAQSVGTQAGPAPSGYRPAPVDASNITTL